MKRLLLLSALSLSLAAPAHAANDVTAQLDALVAQHFPADQPGAAVLVKKGDQILLRKGYGMADMQLAVPMRPELVFKLGSITKQFTATAIMMLAEKGKLSVKDDIRKFLPNYPTHGATITLEHLLTHTSGIPSYTEQPGMLKAAREDLTHEELLALFKDVPLEFQPGTKWSYSNSNYYLLGMVIEKVAGKRYGQFLEENIFTPLGMTHTGYGDQSRIIAGMVSGYQREGDQLVNAPMMSMALPGAAGGLVSTVDDMALWDRAIGAGKLLSKAGWTRVFTAEKLKDGSSSHYGFGWGIGEYAGHPMISHGGAIPGFNTDITRLPADRVLVVILCNSLPAPVPVEGLALQLAGLAIGKPVIAPRVATVDHATLDRYAGVYKVDATQRMLVRRDGDGLTMQRTGGPLLELTPESDTKFFVKDTPIRAVFAVDGTGHVTRVDITQPDGSHTQRARTDEPLPAGHEAITLDAKTLDSYVGEYELAPAFVLAITRHGTQLFAQATGQPQFELFASAPGELFLKVVDAQLSVHVDVGGHGDSVVLHQNGRDMPGKRVR